MTSWEALSFYAGIILPPSTSPDKKRARIREVLAMMGLSHARDTLVRLSVCHRVSQRVLMTGLKGGSLMLCGVCQRVSVLGMLDYEYSARGFWQQRRHAHTHERPVFSD
jgi:hypothetical protein